jgi:hypothetical protein
MPFNQCGRVLVQVIDASRDHPVHAAVRGRCAARVGDKETNALLCV